jgi:hypothetical protein
LPFEFVSAINLLLTGDVVIVVRIHNGTHNGTEGGAMPNLTVPGAEGLEYVRTFKVPKLTGISRTQLLAWERADKLKIFRPSKKMALIRWRDLVALIEGERSAEPQTA